MLVRELVALLKLDSTKATSEAKKFEAVIVGVRKSLLTLSTIATASIGAAALALGKVAKDTANYGDQVATAASNAGIAARAYQQLGAAAAMADVEQSEFDTGMKMFSRTIGEAARGTKTYTDLFAALGVKLRMGDGKLRTNQDLLNSVSDALAGMRDASVRASYAQELFGRSGVRMGVFMGQGSEAIWRMRMEAQQLGLVMSDEGLKAAGDFDDGMKRLRFSMTGLRNTIGTTLLPWINRLIDRFNDWYKTNGAVIRQKIEDWVENTAKAIPALIDGVVRAFKSVQDFATGLQVFIGRIGGWKVALGGVAAFMGLGFVASIWKAIGAIQALSVALVTTPAGQVLLAAAGITLAARDINEAMRGRPSVTGGIVDAFKKGGADTQHVMRGPAFAFAGSPHETLARGSARGPRVVAPSLSIGKIELNVPAGTSAEQAKNLDQQFRRKVDSWWSEKLSDAIGNEPGYARP